jgi:predicted AAA+ superfamily ATPase
LERDVREITKITDLHRFRIFLDSIAIRCGQELIYSDIANDVGVKVDTIQN